MNSLSSKYISIMTKYMDEYKEIFVCDNPLDLWRAMEATYPRIAPVPLNLLNAVASLAFVEHILCVGLLLSGLGIKLLSGLPPALRRCARFWIHLACRRDQRTTDPMLRDDHMTIRTHLDLISNADYGVYL